MPAHKHLTDLIGYTSVLPYASEMFGIYQRLQHQEGVKTGTIRPRMRSLIPRWSTRPTWSPQLPIDRFYEHDFYPLQGGFRANVQANYEIFDQSLQSCQQTKWCRWKVKRDSKAGRQI